MKKKLKVSLIVVFLIIFLVGGVLVLKGKDKTEKNDHKPIKQKTEDKVTINRDDQLEADTIKEDESKDYVYDANYKYDSSYKVKEYKSLDQIDQPNQLLRGKGTIAAPYVNINTTDGKKVNKEIKKVYIATLKDIEKIMKCEKKDPTKPCGGTYFNYITYQNNDYLTVIVITSKGIEEQSPTLYYGYVFDLKTGKLLSTNDIASIKELTLDQLEEKTKKAIDKFTKEQDKLFGSNTYTKELSKTYKELHSSINDQGYVSNDNDGIIYFLDKKNKLKVIVNINVDLEVEKYAYLLDIE